MRRAMKKAKTLIRLALNTIDVGGEQSRGFANEITVLKEAYRVLNEAVQKKGGKRGTKSTHNN